MSKIIDNILFVPGKRRPAPMDRHREDRRWLTVCIVLFFAAHLIVWGMDEAAYRAAEADKPPAAPTWEAPLDQPRLLEAITLQLEPDPYREDVPLDRELQAVLREACKEHGVPVSLALGLIEVESGFRADAVSGEGAYGLCQLNPRYFPADLDPAGNITAGVAWLGGLLKRHEDAAAALRAYNLGWDDGDRKFAGAVLSAAERWEE